MVQSLNTKSEYVDAATWFRGIPTYGKVLVGDKAVSYTHLTLPTILRV